MMLLHGFIRIDDRPQKGGWAKGNYYGKCCLCENQFTGDKQAVHCAPCAYGDNLKTKVDNEGE